MLATIIIIIVFCNIGKRATEHDALNIEKAFCVFSSVHQGGRHHYQGGHDTTWTRPLTQAYLAYAFSKLFFGFSPFAACRVACEASSLAVPSPSLSSPPTSLAHHCERKSFVMMMFIRWVCVSVSVMCVCV